MPLSHVEVGEHAGTIGAVVVGALLATLGGIGVSQVEAWLRRRDRERTAALLFGESLSGLRLLLENAQRARGIGEPYGPFTLRLLRAARREIDIYERNRESLLDLRNPALRVDIHVMMVSTAMSLDGIIESAIGSAAGDDDARDQAFAFMVVGLGRMPPLVERLGRIARHRFDDFDRVQRGTAPAPAQSSARQGE